MSLVFASVSVSDSISVSFSVSVSDSFSVCVCVFPEWGTDYLIILFLSIQVFKVGQNCHSR